MRRFPIIAALAALVLALAVLPVFARPAVVSAAKVPPVALAVPRPVAARFPSLDPEADTAHALLRELAATYRLLDGVTIRIGATPRGEQAVAYYAQSEIVVSPDHAASLRKIVRHEIWHIIDWRDNGRIDWGESLPPANAADYLK